MNRISLTTVEHSIEAKKEEPFIVKEKNTVEVSLYIKTSEKTTQISTKNQPRSFVTKLEFEPFIVPEQTEGQDPVPILL